MFLNLKYAICRKLLFWGLANEIEKFDQFRVHSRYRTFRYFGDCVSQSKTYKQFLILSSFNIDL
jgi:hypothetical protein